MREAEFPPGSVFLLLSRAGPIIPHLQQTQDFGCALEKSRVGLRADEGAGKGQQKPQENPWQAAGATLNME